MDQTPEEHWRDLSERILTEISEWRRSHPKATFREIEDARPHTDEPTGSATARGIRRSRVRAEAGAERARTSDHRVLCVRPLCMHEESANASCKEPEDKQSR